MVTNHTIACVKQPTFCDASTGLPAKVSFRKETSGSVTKCRLFSQATCVQPSPNSVSWATKEIRDVCNHTNFYLKKRLANFQIKTGQSCKCQQYIYLADFLKTKLAEFQPFGWQRAPKQVFWVRLNYTSEWKGKEEERRRREKSKGCTLSFYIGYFGEEKKAKKQ